MGIIFTLDNSENNFDKLLTKLRDAFSRNGRLNSFFLSFHHFLFTVKEFLYRFVKELNQITIFIKYFFEFFNFKPK